MWCWFEAPKATRWENGHATPRNRFMSAGSNQMLVAPLPRGAVGKCINAIIPTQNQRPTVFPAPPSIGLIRPRGLLALWVTWHSLGEGRKERKSKRVLFIGRAIFEYELVVPFGWKQSHPVCVTLQFKAQAKSPDERRTDGGAWCRSRPSMPLVLDVWALDIHWQSRKTRIC